MQKQFSSKDDWITQIVDDKKELDIGLSENEIKCMKKYKFKKLIKKKLYEKAREYLFKLKDKHSKTENLTSYSFQKYLSSQELSIQEKSCCFH